MAPELPDFTNPPLTEVVLGVQFTPLSLTGVGLGPFWQEIRNNYPTVEEQPPLPPITEDFGPPKPPQFNIQLLGASLSPRYWFISLDGSQLLQIQRDRLMFNWRRGENSDAVYPKYEIVRAAFDGHYAAFVSFVRESLNTAIEPTWQEVSYINHIPVPGFRQADLARIVRFFAVPDLNFLQSPDDATAAWRFLIRGKEGSPAGRMTVSAQPGFDARDPSKPILNLTLTARGHLADDPLGFLDAAHEYVVQGFADMTTKEMHIEWGRSR